MIIFSNHPFANILIDQFSQDGNLKLVCDETAKELIDYAKSAKIPVLDWRNFKAEPSWDNEWAVVFSFGHIIPEGMINLFCGQIANVHPSLLPQYRGSSPLQSAILNDQKIGYTIIKLSKEMDAGDILFQKEMKFNKSENYGQILKNIITDAAKELQGSFLVEPVEQDHACATYCTKIAHEDLEITERDNAEGAYSKIKCYFPSEKAYLLLESKKYFIHEARLSGDKLEIVTIQPEGKRVMSSKDFLNGYSKLLTTTPSFVKIA